MLRRNRDALRARMAALRSALDLLEAGVNCPHEDITTCPTYQARLAELTNTQISVVEIAAVENAVVENAVVGTRRN